MASKTARSAAVALMLVQVCLPVAVSAQEAVGPSSASQMSLEEALQTPGGGERGQLPSSPADDDNGPAGSMSPSDAGAAAMAAPVGSPAMAPAAAGPGQDPF